MIFKKFLIALIALTCVSVSAQNENSILFSIDNNPIYTSEFLRVYNKNLNILTDETQKDIDNYLDLFINYKLKVTQAQDLGLDTIASYQSELLTYKKQLMEPYLRDDSAVDSLIKEAYDRSLYEVNASHILVKINPNNPTDTIVAYTKIIKARTEIIKGEEFEFVARKYSEDPSVESNGGALGFFTVFSMVYPFENAVYTTEEGEISQPFKTRFGYHIIKMNTKRKALGQVEAAHIMIKGGSLDSEIKINEIYAQLNQGEDFVFLAKTQSEDKYSAAREGSLGKFGSGKMVKEFEDVAFSLENVGDISKPFKTKYGWHIVKLLNKYPVKSYEEAKNAIAQKVKTGDRAKIVSNSVVNKLKNEYDIEINKDALQDFYVENWKENTTDFSKILMTINNEVINQQELVKFLKGNRLTANGFLVFENYQVMEYYKKHLEETNVEFANTYKEYKEGLLLFELLQSRIWDQSKDSLGVQNYFDNHKKNYVLVERFEGDIAVCTDKKSANIVRKQFKKKTNLDSIKKIVNTANNVNVIFNNGTFEKANEIVPVSYEYSVGVSKVLVADNRFIVINSATVLPKMQQELDEIRGKVISDYQEYLEKDWVEELRNSYTVELNEVEINSILNK